MSTSRILLIAAILTISACQTKSSENQTNNQTEGKIETDEKQQITNLLLTYRDALNASDVTKVLPLPSVPIIVRQRLNVNRRAVGGHRDGRFRSQASRC